MLQYFEVNTLLLYCHKYAATTNTRAFVVDLVLGSTTNMDVTKPNCLSAEMWYVALTGIKVCLITLTKGTCPFDGKLIHHF